MGQIQPGQKVLVNGASGGVGTFAVQIAKSFGTEVTTVCSPKNLDYARSLGANHVIDYTQEDFTRNGQVYDLIVAANRYHPIRDYRRVLGLTGNYVVLGGSLTQIFQAMVMGPIISKAAGQKFSFIGIAELNQKDLVILKDLLEAGKTKSLIDKLYPLSETAAAVQYLEEGHAHGKVVITLEDN